MACSLREACAQAVTARRPTFLKLLGKFSDQKGETMAMPWMTPKERKAARAAHQQEVFGITTRSIFQGDELAVLATSAGKEGSKVIMSLAEDGVNPRTADLETLRKASPVLNIILHALKKQPCARSQLHQLVEALLKLKASYSVRKTDAAISAMKASERVYENNGVLTLA